MERASETRSALEAYKVRTQVDCDTLDPEIASTYGPFVDCTSNQAIAYFELQEKRSSSILLKAAELALEWRERFSTIEPEGLAVEIAMALLSLRMLSHLSPDGYVHVQVNPIDSHSTERIVEGAKRIIDICRLLDPKRTGGDTRICIKIPSTWAGLRACRILEQAHGIRTLATTLFSVTQAVVAAEAGCRYIAPYMHGLSDVMNDNLATDAAANTELERKMAVVRTSQAYYESLQRPAGTKVLPAALMSVDECLRLEGVHHITLPPRRIEELAAMSATDAAARTTSMFDGKGDDGDMVFEFDEMERRGKDMIEDASLFDVQMEAEGEMPAKLMREAIDVFGDMQKKLEAMARPLLRPQRMPEMLMKDW